MDSPLRRLLNDRLEPALLDEIEKNGTKVSFKENDIILEVGQFVNIIPILTQGSLKVSKQDEEGHELLLYYITAAETCAMTFTCCMMQHQSEVRAVAEEDGEFIAIPIAKMDEWLVKFPTWKNFVMSTIRNRFHELLNTIEKIAFHKLDDRLVNYLKEKGKNSGSAVIHMTHQQIAEELGTSRVVISRLLKQLENEKKLILYRHEIKLLRAL